MSYRVFDKNLNKYITDEQEWVLKPDGSLHYRTVGYGELVPWPDAMVVNDGSIYLITVFDKCEPDERWGYDLGCRRSVGFRWTLEDAIDTVESNMCDIWDSCATTSCFTSSRLACRTEQADLFHDGLLHHLNLAVAHAEIRMHIQG